MLTPSGWFLLLFWEGVGFLFATCILVLVILRHSPFVNLWSFQLVAVDRTFKRENCEVPGSIIPSALDTPMNETETEPILATVT